MFDRLVDDVTSISCRPPCNAEICCFSLPSCPAGKIWIFRSPPDNASTLAAKASTDFENGSGPGPKWPSFRTVSACAGNVAANSVTAATDALNRCVSFMVSSLGIEIPQTLDRAMEPWETSCFRAGAGKFSLLVLSPPTGQYDASPKSMQMSRGRP